MARVRLLKVLVQPVFAVDDGENLSELVAEPVAVSAGDWPTYATDKFPEAMAALERQVAGE